MNEQLAEQLSRRLLLQQRVADLRFRDRSALDEECADRRIHTCGRPHRLDARRVGGAACAPFPLSSASAALLSKSRCSSADVNSSSAFLRDLIGTPTLSAHPWSTRAERVRPCPPRSPQPFAPGSHPGAIAVLCPILAGTIITTGIWAGNTLREGEATHRDVCHIYKPNIPGTTPTDDHVERE